MQNKWYQHASWRNQDAGNSSPSGLAQQPQPTATSAEAARESRTPATNPANGFAATVAELQTFEEIYRSAGIKGPRMGYSIAKVIEMLHSEHIRSLPPEMKRASLLMALEAAGVQVDEVLQDATLRQRSLNSYEAIQRKHLEEYEARKAQDNCAIQAEMERVAAEYSARINHNLDEIGREKENFRKWQARKQQEAQRIAEAVALCVTQSGPKPVPADPMAPFRELAAAGEPAFVHRG